MKEIDCTDSSNLQHARYDEETRVLEVAFKPGGKAFAYDGVPLEVWNGFAGAASKGGFFSAQIRNAKTDDGLALKFPPRQIDQPPVANIQRSIHYRSDLLWHDGERIHACEGDRAVDSNPNTFLVWTLCSRDVPANSSLGGPYSLANCPQCIEVIGSKRG